MKKSLYSLLIVLLCSSITSCKKSACSDVVCQNGSTCNSGKCECAAGYRGKNCEILIKNDLIGATYKGNCNGSCSNSAETCADSVQIIDNTTGETKFYIVLYTSTGYHKVLANATSYYSNNNEVSFDIPEQPFGSITVKGSGTYSLTNDILTFDLNTYCASFNLLRQ